MYSYSVFGMSPTSRYGSWLSSQLSSHLPPVQWVSSPPALPEQLVAAIAAVIAMKQMPKRFMQRVCSNLCATDRDRSSGEFAAGCAFTAGDWSRQATRLDASVFQPVTSDA